MLLSEKVGTLCMGTIKPLERGARCVTPARAAAKETQRTTSEKTTCFFVHVFSLDLSAKAGRKVTELSA